jgi:hypothetical protein
MAFDFPSSPVMNQKFTAGQTVYTWNGYAWSGGPVADMSQFQPKDPLLTSAAALATDGFLYNTAEVISGRGQAASGHYWAASPDYVLTSDIQAATNEVTIPFSGGIVIDGSQGINFLIVLTAVTRIYFRNFPSGRCGQIRMIGSGGAFNCYFEAGLWIFPQYTAYPLVVASGTNCILTYRTLGTTTFASYGLFTVASS